MPVGQLGRPHTAAPTRRHIRCFGPIFCIRSSLPARTRGHEGLEGIAGHYPRPERASDTLWILRGLVLSPLT